MDNAIRLTVAALVLAIVGACIDLSRAQPTPTYVQYAWAETCRLSRYTCEGISPPKVFYIAMANVYGLYLGSKTIFIDTGLKPFDEGETFAMGVVIHEMIHYLQTYEDGQGAYIEGAAHWCATEGEAYTVANWWYAEQNRFDLMVEWQRLGQCWPSRTPRSEEAVITINEDF